MDAHNPLYCNSSSFVHHFLIQYTVMWCPFYIYVYLFQQQLLQFPDYVNTKPYHDHESSFICCWSISDLQGLKLVSSLSNFCFISVTLSIVCQPLPSVTDLAGRSVHPPSQTFVLIIIIQCSFCPLNPFFLLTCSCFFYFLCVLSWIIGIRIIRYFFRHSLFCSSFLFAHPFSSFFRFLPVVNVLQDHRPAHFLGLRRWSSCHSIPLASSPSLFHPFPLGTPSSAGSGHSVPVVNTRMVCRFLSFFLLHSLIFTPNDSKINI